MLGSSLLPREIVMPHLVVPHTVRLAFALWMLAIATAILEVGTRLAVDPRGPLDAVLNSGAELTIRLSAFALLAVLATLMMRGSNIARHALTLLCGGLGTFSLIMEPASWLIGGGNVLVFATEADPVTWIITGSRIAHIAAVLGAVYFGYRGEAGGYFAHRRAKIAG
jgi:hypothetical protein